ncbi:MAG: thymidine phosphorylase [Nanoarchaeota archaeon]|nr:thymidine phosphorylase [Nanoarchaeota archaeon]
MKLKVKTLKFSAGRPVAILHKKFAENSSIHVDERIFIEKGKNKIAAIVDVGKSFLDENEIALSSEIIILMKLKQGDNVNVEIAPKPESLMLIQKKLFGKKLNEKEINLIISDIVKNKLTEAEIAYFISAIYKSGMVMKEIMHMTKAIVNTGNKLNLKGKIVDKHSIGGIPGRTTPIVVSICSAAGLLMPKTSSRAITSPSGTADAMEVLCRVDFNVSELKKIIKKTNACIVWGGSLNIAPADDKIIHVEKLLNLDPKPQLIASIMAKKISVNAKYLLIEIPYGKNAKVSKRQAKVLEKDFKILAKNFGIKVKCFLNKSNEPIGNGVGPVLEIFDVIKVLKRKDKCYKLEDKSLELSGKIFELCGKAKKGKGKEMARRILDSGAAFKKFREIVKAQKGKIREYKPAKYKKDIYAENKTIKEIKTKEINNLARTAGCPLDKRAGVYLYKHAGDKIKKREKILTIYAESKIELREAVKYYRKVKPVRFK